MEFLGSVLTALVTVEYQIFSRHSGIVGHEFLWEGKGSGAAQIQLELTCGSGGEMKVYDYCLAFF